MVKQLLELYSANSCVWEKYGPRIEKEVFDSVRGIINNEFIEQFQKKDGFHDCLLKNIHIIARNKTVSVRISIISVDDNEEISLIFNKCISVQTHGNLISQRIGIISEIIRMHFEVNENGIITTGILLSTGCIVLIEHVDPNIKCVSIRSLRG